MKVVFRKQQTEARKTPCTHKMKVRDGYFTEYSIPISQTQQHTP